MNAQEFPRLEPMASGHQSILLQACDTHEFFHLAVTWTRIIGGNLGDPILGPDQSQCEFTLAGKSFWMVWDIWQRALSLEPKNGDAAGAIPQIFTTITR